MFVWKKTSLVFRGDITHSTTAKMTKRVTLRMPVRSSNHGTSQKAKRFTPVQTTIVAKLMTVVCQPPDEKSGYES